MKEVKAYQSKNGRLFNTENEAIIENAKNDIMIALDFPRPFPLYGLYENSIVELILDNREKLIKILQNMS